MIHPRTLHALDFFLITEHLANLCASSIGRQGALELLPLEDSASVSLAARLYEEAKDWAGSPAPGASPFTLAPFPDISILLRGVAANPSLRPDTDACWALREMLRQAREAHASIATAGAEKRWPNLLRLANASPLPVQLTSALLRCISDDGLIQDESSPELYRLRAELRRLHQNCMRKVKEYAAQYNMLAFLQDEFMTLSSDRYVLPLKANFKGRMQGIIHDWSQTGETCYFEPIFLVEINNRLQELKREEREEERKILAYLGELLVAELPSVLAAQKLLRQVDILSAKRRLAAAFDGQCLSLAPADEGISLLEARHPLLALAGAHSDGGEKRKVRPLDIVLRPGDRALVVTGGNAGGKTVCLKTLGLITAMVLSGLPVPVGKGSHLPWFGRVDAFIGDEQSLTDHVSTFTAQIEHLSKAWKHLNADSLVLLDEFGAGTDPAQGSALAQAVLDSLLEKHTFVLAATHFPSLKSYALARERVRAASMLFDPQSKKPLYKLAYDQVGASRALDVARSHGLPEGIIRRAEQYLLQDGEDTSALLARLNDLAARREEELRMLGLEREKAHRAAEESRAKLQKERDRLHDEVRAQSLEIMRAWKEGRAAHKQTLKEMAQLRASLQPVADSPKELPEPESFFIGQKVLHNVFHRQGTVTDTDPRRQRVRLDMGGVVLWAAMKDLCLSGDAEKPTPRAGMPRGARASSDARTTDTPSMRLDMRGMRADAALAELGRFLDKSLLAGFAELEVVHGKGTGALRRQVHDFLRQFPAVESFSLAPEDRGGDGMTLVTLR